MKKNFLSIALLLFAITAHAQVPATTFSSKTPATISAWGNRSVYRMKGYWEMAIPQLEKKFSKNLVDSIEKYSAEMYYPAILKDVLDNDLVTPDKNTLKMYLVATFDNNFNGSFHGVIDVIWIPKAENKNWGGKDGIWQHDIFMLFPKEAVTIKE